MALTVAPFIRMTRARRAELNEQAERVGKILGATPEPHIGEVTVGGHAWPVDNSPALSAVAPRIAA
ncbi:hypothetical protein [Actinophytocola sp. NPDC049390]|uniref:hypothetical protein n=1 Tax=Actinophytocola sp. NPDC049390 TaxID=3363894 RepID=UPI0037AC676E